MKVLLLQDIKSLGKRGEIVNVSEGYARNMLIPTKKAQIATDGVLKNVNEKIAIDKAKEEKNKQDAIELSNKLSKEKFVLKAKVGQDSSKLFGAITSQEIANIINNKFNINLDKKKINLKETIKNVGNYHISIKLYTGVIAEISLEVVAE